jgi:hypothetical protein
MIFLLGLQCEMAKCVLLWFLVNNNDLILFFGCLWHTKYKNVTDSIKTRVNAPKMKCDPPAQNQAKVALILITE